MTTPATLHSKYFAGKFTKQPYPCKLYTPATNILYIDFRTPGLYTHPMASGQKAYVPVGTGINSQNVFGVSGMTVVELTTTQPKAISAATQANPCQLTVTGHGLTTGNVIFIENVVGMTQLNNALYTVTVVDANTITLDGVNSTGYTAYGSGGSCITPAAFKRISAATQTNPCRLTITGHGLSTDDMIKITGVGGMTQLNGNFYEVTVVDANTITLNGVDATAYGAYTSSTGISRKSSDTLGTTELSTGNYIFWPPSCYSTSNISETRDVEIIAPASPRTGRNVTINGGNIVRCQFFDSVMNWHADIGSGATRAHFKIYNMKTALVVRGVAANNNFRYGWDAFKTGNDSGEFYMPIIILADCWGSGVVSLEKSGTTGSTVTKTISAATKANPCQLTVTSHGLSTGGYIYVKDVVGMTQLNGRTYQVTKIDNNTLTLNGVDSSAYDTYTGGGSAVIANAEFATLFPGLDPARAGTLHADWFQPDGKFLGIFIFNSSGSTYYQGIFLDPQAWWEFAWIENFNIKYNDPSFAAAVHGIVPHLTLSDDDANIRNFNMANDVWPFIYFKNVFAQKKSGSSFEARSVMPQTDSVVIPSTSETDPETGRKRVRFDPETHIYGYVREAEPNKGFGPFGDFCVKGVHAGNVTFTRSEPTRNLAPFDYENCILDLNVRDYRRVNDQAFGNEDITDVRNIAGDYATAVATITDVSDADPCVITVADASNINNGDRIFIGNVGNVTVGGVSLVNGKFFTVSNKSGNTFQIGISTLPAIAYSSGGIVVKANMQCFGTQRGVVYQNGHHSLYFDGINDYAKYTGGSTIAGEAYLAVAGQSWSMYDAFGPGDGCPRAKGNQINYYIEDGDLYGTCRGAVTLIKSNFSKVSLIGAHWDGSTLIYSIDSAEIIGNVGSAVENNAPIEWGRNGSTQYYNGAWFMSRDFSVVRDAAWRAEFWYWMNLFYNFDGLQNVPIPDKPVTLGAIVNGSNVDITFTASQYQTDYPKKIIGNVARYRPVGTAEWTTYNPTVPRMTSPISIPDTVFSPGVEYEIVVISLAVSGSCDQFNLTPVRYVAPISGPFSLADDGLGWTTKLTLPVNAAGLLSGQTDALEIFTSNSPNYDAGDPTLESYKHPIYFIPNATAYRCASPIRPGAYTDSNTDGPARSEFRHERNYGATERIRFKSTIKVIQANASSKCTCVQIHRLAGDPVIKGIIQVDSNGTTWKFRALCKLEDGDSDDYVFNDGLGNQVLAINLLFNTAYTIEYDFDPVAETLKIWFNTANTNTPTKTITGIKASGLASYIKPGGTYPSDNGVGNDNDLWITELLMFSIINADGTTVVRP